MPKLEMSIGGTEIEIRVSGVGGHSSQGIPNIVHDPLPKSFSRFKEDFLIGKNNTLLIIVVIAMIDLTDKIELVSNRLMFGIVPCWFIIKSDLLK